MVKGNLPGLLGAVSQLRAAPFEWLRFDAPDKGRLAGTGSFGFFWPLIARMYARGRMSVYSVAQAKDHLSKLIDEALAGEEVTITRHGKPVVELRPARAADAGRLPPELIDRIAARAKSLPSLGEDAVDIIRRMRDDYP
jgi:prevent-host-death family protein